MARKIRKSVLRNLRNLGLAFLIVFIGILLFQVGFELRIYFLNRAELNDIEKVNQHSAEVFRSFVKEIQDKTDWEVSIISGYRSREEQIKLKRNDPRNASVTKSRHVMGRAIDINLYRREGLKHVWLKKGNSTREWRRTGVDLIAARYHLTWGGSYHNYHDPVHFEIH